MVEDAKCCKYLNGSQKSLIYSRTLKRSGFGVAATRLSSSCGLNTKHIPACGWEWFGTLWRSTGNKERGWEGGWPWAMECFICRLQPGPGQWAGQALLADGSSGACVKRGGGSSPVPWWPSVLPIKATSCSGSAWLWRDIPAAQGAALTGFDTSSFVFLQTGLVLQLSCSRDLKPARVPQQGWEHSTP